MKHPFDLDDFESFLSEQSDRHRMYASDRVWRNIQEKLHGVDRWPALTFGSILTVAIISIMLTLTYPHKNLISTNDSFDLSRHTSSASPNDENRLFTEVEPAGKVEKIASLLPLPIKPENTSTNFILKPELASPTISMNENLFPEANHSQNNADLHNESEVNQSLAIEDIMAENEIPSGNWEKKIVELQPSNINRNSRITYLPLLKNSLKITDASEPWVAFGAKENDLQEIFTKTSLEYGPVQDKPISASKSKLALQIYATPSISYRYLLEDKKYIENANSGPIAPYLTNSVNKFVRHQPKMGLEFGGALLFRVSDNFRFKTGLQFNYRQFGISAYSLMQYVPANFALNGNGGLDSMVAYTRISAQNGQSPLELTSSFFQVAIPIGFDLKVSQIKKVDFFVSASSQFTYNLSSLSYLISSDFKNYLAQPHTLDRRFNINTAVEAFASFDAGGVTWQAGPQIRYQMLPGSKNAYPIREHLIDYGFKVGVVKRLR